MAKETPKIKSQGAKRSQGTTKAKTSTPPQKTPVTDLLVYSSEGKELKRVKLDERLTKGRINKALLSQVLLQAQANQRQGTQKAKTRSEVSGGGRKPWRQKGTGRARVGSIRSPLWRGGGVIFAPSPRDYHTRIPKQLRMKALLMSLSAKVRDNEVLLIEPISMKEPKTKQIAALLEALPGKGKTLMVAAEITRPLQLSARNIPQLDLKVEKDINAYDLLRHRRLIVDRTAFDALLSRSFKKQRAESKVESAPKVSA